VLWVGRDLQRPSSPTPCSEQGHLQLAQGAQSPVRPGLGCSQGWGIRSFSEQPVPGFHQPPSKEFPPSLQPKATLISVCKVISQNNMESVITGMDAVPENGKIFCMLVLETILRYVIKENSRAEKIKTILCNLYLKKARGSPMIRVGFQMYFLFIIFGMCLTCQA